jgi:drug/metabolite transporter (DMT)-like permease
MTAVAPDSGRSPVLAGMGFAVLSAGSFGLSGSLGSGLMAAGWSSGAAVAVRVLVAAAVLLPAAIAQLRGRWSLLRRHAGTLVGYGLVPVAGAQLAYFNAVQHLQVGVALLVEYVAPVAVVGWLWARHGQRPGRLTVAGGGVALLGLVLVLGLLSGVQVSLVGVLWAVAAMASVSVYFVMSSAHDGLPGVVLATGGLLVGGLGLLVAGFLGVVPLAADTDAVVFRPVTAPWWLVVLVLALVTAAVAYVSGIAATRRLGSRLASFMALGEVLVALVAAWVLLGEVPTPLQVVGGLLVLAGVVVVKVGEGRLPAARPEPVALGR